MIGLRGNFQLTLNVGEVRDFLQPGDLLDLVVEERMGLFLPLCSVSFVTRENRVLNALRDTATVEVSLGGEQEHLSRIGHFTIVNKTLKRRGQQEYVVRLGLMYNALDFLNRPRMRNIRGRSTDVFRQVLSQYFSAYGEEVDGTADDSMNWLQYNVSDRRFLWEVWLHSYVVDSVLLPCLGSDGRAELRDFRTLVSRQRGSNVKWKFSDGDLEGYIPYSSLSLVESRTGFHNLLYDRDTPTLDLLTGTYSVESYQYKARMSVYGEEKHFTKLLHPLVPLNDNVHRNYARAYLQNVTVLSSLFTTRYSLVLNNRYMPVRLGDLVYVRESDLTQDQLAEEVVSGYYVVSRVVWQVVNQTLNMTLELVRDYLNLGGGT